MLSNKMSRLSPAVCQLSVIPGDAPDRSGRCAARQKRRDRAGVIFPEQAAVADHIGMHDRDQPAGTRRPRQTVAAARSCYPLPVILLRTSLPARQYILFRHRSVNLFLCDQRLGAGVQDRVHVHAVFAIEVGQVAALAETVGAERDHALAAHRAQPGMRGGMAVQDRDQRRARAPAAPRSARYATRRAAPPRRARMRVEPAGMQPVRDW